MTDEGRSLGPFLVLMVCTGNICRSPMAELFMRDELNSRFGSLADLVVVDGAGTYGGHVGEPINPPAGRALAELGVDATAFRAQGLSEAAVEAADLVVCAAAEHVRRALSLVPGAAERTFTLLELAARADSLGKVAEGVSPVARLDAVRALAARHRSRSPLPALNVSDPYGQSMHVYRETALQIRSAVRSIVGSTDED